MRFRDTCLALAALVACGAPRPKVRPTVELLAAAAAACAHEPPGSVDIEPIVIAGGRWQVRPSSRVAEYVIDVNVSTCDDVPFELPATGGDSPLDAVLDLATRCAQRGPYHGLGTGGSPLVWSRPIIHWRNQHVSVEWDEVTPKSKPPGAEVSVDVRTDTCHPVPRD